VKLLIFVLGFATGAGTVVAGVALRGRPAPALPLADIPQPAATAPAATLPAPPPPASPTPPPPFEPPPAFERTPPPTDLPVAISPKPPDLPSPPPALPALSDLDRLRARALLLPIQGLDLRTLHDSFSEGRNGRPHEAIDILAPRGTPVLAVDDGPVRKLFTSARGGLTVYQFDPEGLYCYYYAHLDRYAEGLSEGAALRKGARVGYVGTTGNAPPGTPHLHFTIFRLGPEKNWWEGIPVNPYPLWARPEAAARR
jgi:murein DD-endopeptidase MepM/ murein hydrolase activator NlpD